jgi:hypothetical protein
MSDSLFDKQIAKVGHDTLDNRPQILSSTGYLLCEFFSAIGSWSVGACHLFPQEFNINV